MSSAAGSTTEVVIEPVKRKYNKKPKESAASPQVAPTFPAVSPAVSSVENSSTPAKSRETIIKEAIQTMLQAHARWSRSTDNFFPEYLEDAISAALNIAMNGDIPESCIKLHACIVRLADAWVKIVQDSEGIDQNGIPGAHFWSLFEAVDSAMRKSASAQNRHLRPVKDLLEEYKGDLRKHSYVAKDYGWLDKSGDEPIWKGPFFRDGNVDMAAIEREAASPGSVVPADWHPEDENEKLKKQIIADSGSALARIRDHLKSKGKLQGDSDKIHEPLSVEELLREGQFVSNIAKFKNVSEQEVRATAKKLGIRAMTKEDVFELAQQDDEDPGDKMIRESMIGSDEDRQAKYDQKRQADDELGLEEFENAELDFIENPDFSQTDLLAGKEEEPSDSSEESVDSLLEKLYNANPEIDTPNAMKILRGSGVKTTGQAVGRILAAMRSRPISNTESEIKNPSSSPAVDQSSSIE